MYNRGSLLANNCRIQRYRPVCSSGEFDPLKGQCVDTLGYTLQVTEEKTIEGTGTGRSRGSEVQVQVQMQVEVPVPLQVQVSFLSQSTYLYSYFLSFH